MEKLNQRKEIKMVLITCPVDNSYKSLSLKNGLWLGDNRRRRRSRRRKKKKKKKRAHYEFSEGPTHTRSIIIILGGSKSCDFQIIIIK